jgi:hypothetical protein
MNIDVLADAVMNNHVELQSFPLSISSMVLVMTRARQLTAHNRMTGYLLMNDAMYKRMMKVGDMETLCAYPGEPEELKNGAQGKFFGLYVHTSERIPEDMMFAAMVEEKLCIAAVGMKMY